MKRLLLSFTTVFLLSGFVLAQDIHFSQFFNSPLNTNPALTGIFNGDIRFGLHFKQQWKSVPVDYLTFSGFADKKFYGKKSDKGFFGAGIVFNYDRAGDSRMSLTQGALSGTYTFIINEKNLVTFGAQLGLSGVAVDFNSNLRWPSQFVEDQYQPGADNQTGMNGKVSGTNVDFGGGLNYRLQKDVRTKLDIGFGAFNVLAPDQAFYGSSVDLPLRFSGNLSGSLQLSDLLDLQLHGLAQFQGEYREFVPALNVRLHLNQNKGKKFALDIGGIARMNQDEVDAWTPYFGFDFNNWFLGLNYDVNASKFDVGTDGKGGPELFVRYIITTVKPLKTFKNCPIF